MKNRTNKPSIEIERKFLVVSDFPRNEPSQIQQGYLQTNPDCTVRVRLARHLFETKGFLTIKGSSNASGTSRYEFETEIPIFDTERLLTMCVCPIVEKTRYQIKHFDCSWAIDAFLGANQGLVLAEIELQAEHQFFKKPDFIGKEVTGDARFYNVNLATNPYSHWKKTF